MGTHVAQGACSELERVHPVTGRDSVILATEEQGNLSSQKQDRVALARLGAAAI